MNFYQFLIPRLNGAEIDSNFNYYLSLVKKGIGGFIVFGGELESVRNGLARLQSESELPLLIASDLEQGLGQQIEGGTLFPPAMAMSEAARKDPDAVRQAFEHIALEAAHAGINTVLAPVLDININPDNPIICTRAFGDSPQKVASLGIQMIKAFQSNGIMACGKHFPGHGATDIDSHISLPTIRRTLDELESCELIPFREAVSSGVEMMMPGHLSVPAIDSSGAPMTISAQGLRYLREMLGFKGVIITDAMNMGGVASKGMAPSLLALKAGVDFILHPDNPEEVADILASSGLNISSERVSAFRKRLLSSLPANRPQSANDLCRHLTDLAIGIEGPSRILASLYVVTISDEPAPKGEAFISALNASGHVHITPEEPDKSIQIPDNSDVIVAVFSEPKAWKGETVTWIRSKVRELSAHSDIFTAFGNPYTLSDARIHEMRDEVTKAYAYWTSETSQQAMAEKLKEYMSRT